MKKASIAAMAVLSFANMASADVIKCHFTEPFITTTYSMTQQTLTTVDDAQATKKVLKNISFQIKGPGQFELRNVKGQIIQVLSLNQKGSDGMSDTVYPYEAQDWSFAKTHSRDTSVSPLWGGCTSNFLASRPGEDQN